MSSHLPPTAALIPSPEIPADNSAALPRHTKKGSVVLSVHKELSPSSPGGATYTFTVTDSGLGMSEVQVVNAFQKYWTPLATDLTKEVRRPTTHEVVR